jgi:ATP-binding cassette subfamily C protein
LIYRKKIKKIGLQRADADQRKIDDLQKSFHIIQSIKLDGIEDFFINKFNKSSFMSAKLLSIFNLFNDLNKPIWELFILLSFSIAMYVGYNFFGLFRVDLVIIVATFVVAFFRFLPSLNRILNSLSTLNFTLITKREENVNKPESFSKIKLENISFKYDDKSAFILNQLNLIIEKNSLTFIKGESGAGKSTLLNIICGLLKPTIGEVLLDNRNINLFLKFYRSKIGYVPQKTLLFDDTILDNIALGRNKKNLDLNFVKEIIYKTRLNKLIDKLPNGLNTVIGEKGSFLSGGEQQRIGIARALFKKPEILVLDEATSALDEKTENLLLNEVLELTNDLTIIMVSHKKIKINKKLELFELFDKKTVKI